jgi:hypothetical protein
MNGLRAECKQTDPAMNKRQRFGSYRNWRLLADPRFEPDQIRPLKPVEKYFLDDSRDRRSSAPRGVTLCLLAGHLACGLNAPGAFCQWVVAASGADVHRSTQTERRQGAERRWR